MLAHPQSCTLRIAYGDAIQYRLVFSVDRLVLRAAHRNGDVPQDERALVQDLQQFAQHGIGRASGEPVMELPIDGHQAFEVPALEQFAASREQ